jgi:hypothetical protein
MDEDADWFRPPWEAEHAPRHRTSGHSGGDIEALLIPLARTQDAVARLEASVGAAPEDVAAGLRGRLARFEAAGYLAHRGPPVHPHDLALRDASLTGSYALAALTGRLKREAPWTHGGSVAHEYFAGARTDKTATSLTKLSQQEDNRMGERRSHVAHDSAERSPVNR